MTLLVMILLLLLLLAPVHAVEITEIRYEGSEFIELFSNETINLSNNKVFDSSSEERFNTLTLINQTNSSFYLIVGSKFLEEYNISTLNCTIYQTDKSQVSNGGLKDSGEFVKVEINDSLNISLEPTSFPKNYTPCFNIKIEVPKINKTNSTLAVTCSEQFRVNSKEAITLSKIQFDFDFSGPEQEIEYWVETLEGIEVRDRRITTNTNIKSYTPKGSTQVYNISAIARYDNCTYYNSTLVTHYSNQELEEIKPNSIEILNKEELSFLEEEELDLLVFRNSSETKKSIKVYVNGKLQETFSVDKDDTLRTSVDLEIEEGKNIIKIEGLGLEQEFYINNKEEFFQYVEQIQIVDSPQKIVELSRPKINQSKLLSQFYSTENISGDCVVMNGRSFVSNRENISNMSVVELKIEVEEINKTELKLSCRYKENNQSSYKYLSHEFNYTKPIVQEVNITEDLQTLFLSNVSLSATSTNISEREVKNYVSKNSESKRRGPWFVIFGALVSFGAMFTIRDL